MEIASCDLFCAVVDNYGDIGIASRLARQLHEEQGLQVRLWVNDLQSFHQLHKDISIQVKTQDWNGVEVRHWAEPFPGVVPHDLVIEAFACELPGAFLQAMATRPVKPVWINLEYLTAEQWVEGCHGLPSPHPRLPLVKYFFFPGFTPATGGVLREQGLMEEIRKFRNEPAARQDFWQAMAVPPADQGETRVSLFAYENSSIPSLLECMARNDAPITCLLPAGRALGPALHFLGKQRGEIGACFKLGNLTLHIVPFLSPSQYDCLLWACDINIVRGEDSFIRAQFAGRPMLWQAYVQEDAAHEKKVQAWLDIYLASLPSSLAERVRRLFMAWNRGEAVPGDTLDVLSECRSHAVAWTDYLASQTSLSDALVKFARTRV